MLFKKKQTISHRGIEHGAEGFSIVDLGNVLGMDLSELFLEGISRQIKLVYYVTKSIWQNKCLLAMGFHWIGLMTFRVIKFRMPAFAGYVNNAILFKNSFEFSQLQWLRHS